MFAYDVSLAATVLAATLSGVLGFAACLFAVVAACPPPAAGVPPERRRRGPRGPWIPTSGPPAGPPRPTGVWVAIVAVVPETGGAASPSPGTWESRLSPTSAAYRISPALRLFRNGGRGADS